MRKFSFLLIILSFNAFSSIDVISSKEMAEMDSINTKLKDDSLLQDLEIKISEYNKSINDYNITQQKLSSIKKQYGYLLNNSSEFSTPEILSERLILLINDKNKLEAKAKVKDGKKLNKKDELAKIQKRLKEKQEEIHYELLNLKKKITERILADVKANQMIDVTLSASIKCSKTQYLRQCLNGSKESILTGLRHSNIFLDETSVPTNYEIVDASMSLDGTLNYTVSASFKPVYSDEVAAEVNDKLGLVSTTITLHSNVPVQWYIDGVQNKIGKDVKVDLVNGVHSIIASYKGESKSVVKNINDEEKLYFPFNLQDSNSENKDSSNEYAKKPISLPDTKLVEDIKDTIDNVTKTSSRQHSISFKPLYENGNEIVAYDQNGLFKTNYSHALSLCESNNHTLVDTGKLLSLLNLRLIESELLKYPYMTFDEAGVKVMEYSVVRSESKNGIVICY